VTPPPRSLSLTPPQSENTPPTRSQPRLTHIYSLEADGVVSVYVNGKFVWQLPKRLLYEKVPSAKPKEAPADDDAPAIWEITGCSAEAFSLFNEWLYSPRGQLKEPLPGKSVNVYFEVNQLASQYGIHDLTSAVSTIIKKFFNDAENLAAVGQSYGDLPPKSPERSTISGRFAALVLAKQINLDTLKPLIESTALTRDILIWIIICKQSGIDQEEFQKIFDWMAEKYQAWVEAQV
jgi:hypothetical protein